MVEDYGYCEIAKWECHDTEECGKLAKCEGRQCLCQDNVCETKQTLNPVTPEPGDQKDRGWGVDFKDLHLDPPWFCKGIDRVIKGSSSYHLQCSDKVRVCNAETKLQEYVQSLRDYALKLKKYAPWMWEKEPASEDNEYYYNFPRE